MKSKKSGDTSDILIKTRIMKIKNEILDKKLRSLAFWLLLLFLRKQNM